MADKLSPHFSRSEFACKCGCGFNTVDVELLMVLEDVRTHFDVPVTINSGCRCYAHNLNEGGSGQSRHVVGQAADIVVHGVHADAVADYLMLKHSGRYGLGRYDGRTHIDVRSNKARWDRRRKTT